MERERPRERERERGTDEGRETAEESERACRAGGSDSSASERPGKETAEGNAAKIKAG